MPPKLSTVGSKPPSAGRIGLLLGLLALLPAIAVEYRHWSRRKRPAAPSR